MTMHLSQNLKNSALKFPTNIAYVFKEQSTTYAELNKLVDRFASGLSSKGIGKGDTVALLLGNSPQFVIAYYGILRIGAVVVPINPTYTLREISYILSNSQAKAAFATSSLQPILSVLKNQLENLRLVIYNEAVEAECTFEQFLQEANDFYEVPYIDKEDLALILYTSGTTGEPKGVMLSHQNMVSNAEATCKEYELNEEDRVVAVVPMFHVLCMTCCINTSISRGATILILPKFSPSEVVRTIREQKATVFIGVPTMYNFMLQLPDTAANDFSSIRFCISAGASIPLEILNRFEERYRVIIMEGYGLSEASPSACCNPLGGVRKPGSIGIAIDGVKVKVVDPNGREVPIGEVGELIIQGPNVMKGYLGMPEATAIALKDGWLYTGDLAKMDEDEYFYIVDRKKDMILAGGYNIYPREVEEVLYQHSSVAEAAVIGVPDQEYGESVKAYIVKKDDNLTADDIIRFCLTRLAKYKVPKQVAFLTELPKNTTGKILRRKLKQ
jgi:long-chain acyl-CoA synthetase